ncbi:adenylosuccinate synthase [Candidatus Woesearchaeota archaeon]|nr:adenylosuccinate synthase [Candidatus Woesearchaeota archaeon]
MTNTHLVGLQWGDEGKGKDVDILSEKHEVIVRYQGGGNAGHTVVIDGKVYKLHLVPSGILRDGKINIIGDNVVWRPQAFLEEVAALEELGIHIEPGKNLIISDGSHLTLPYQQALDAVEGGKVGTTGRGIGQTYEDSRGRTGIRAFELFDPSNLEAMIKQNTDYYNHKLRWHGPDVEQLSHNQVFDDLSKIREQLIPFIRPDTREILLKYDGSVLFEGAQGTLLDIDLGTWPFVTSSNPTKGGVYTGTGVSLELQRVIGILKAYQTRVGNGPFATEQENDTGERLRERGKEFGTTTGRPRRCGWLDLFAGKYACEVNGVTEISLTKLDVLDDEGTIRFGVGYELDGKQVDYFPRFQMGKCEPIYDEMLGWKVDTTKARKPSDLPKNARRYIERIETYLDTPVKRVGVGKGRDQTIEFD